MSTWWLRAFGWMASGLSLFNLTRKIWNIELSSLMAEIVRFYTTMFHPLANAIADALGRLVLLIGLSIPRLDPDVVVVYLFLGATLRRSLVSEEDPKLERLFILIGTILAWPCWLLLVVSRGIVKYCKESIYTISTHVIFFDEVRDFIVDWVREIAIAIFVFIFFFGLNAYGPSL